METNTRSQDDASAPFSVSDTLLWEALPHLQLNIAQTATLCGISVRQLGYWTKQGYVAASGRGARRMYGLDSLRRILAVRSAMNSGASLRQALKTTVVSGSVAVPVVADPPMFRVPVDVTTPALPPADADALAADLLALFAANHYTRDDVFGLAVKVGRAPDDTRSVAESLCSLGMLLKTNSPAGAVFQRARKDGV